MQGWPCRVIWASLSLPEGLSAHAEAGISGTWVARKAGLTAKQIFNTRGVEEVEEWFRKRKGS